MKKIAAVTMVRNDEFFLRKWVEYYSKELGPENLYVFFDGLDQDLPDFCKDINATKVEKIGNSRTKSDKGRINFISDKAAELFEKGYDLVVGGDADEYLVADPEVAGSLKEFLTGRKKISTLSGLGLDFGQKLGEEGPLHEEKPFLEQRRFARISTRYTKASVITKGCRWGSGFHRVKGKNFHICDNLYLMHFGYSDMGMLERRLNDKSRLSDGWSGHIHKRSKTIRFVNKIKSRSLDSVKRAAFILETMVRPPYAWNKPGLFGLKIIVEIPRRFRQIL